ncbi:MULTISPECIES: crossover junction endodeoxyribonuclease RuvC [Candidatus Ichthyocystis]|uniref:Crossover junction endodeoxyribonuclease RuvC n=1 Tax=Candidatus Ichthyocystis hellenicum TaxID=1561003 RepID=A0A0S4M585_9BURK|nr:MULTISPECIES: crossover junction endodeoxyribonuclease RuvC [Ichthyocystis]CUT17304.1 Crossover junction endodeoxyribonuclease RuvC [Candidatus Ichthyocystis hellenicum]
MTTRILGLDPGSRLTGFGVIDCASPFKFSYVASGVVRTTQGVLALRLKELFEGVGTVVGTFSPDIVCIEKVFVNVNPQSTLCLGQARGVVLCSAAMFDLPISEYTALQIKKSVVGNGHADKNQVQYMVSYLLELQKKVGSDASDALACAICGAQRILSTSGGVGR